MSSSSLLIISCIFFICAFILFLRSRIIFTIITLIYFSGRLPVCTLLICSSVVLFCSFIWSIFSSHPLSFNFLCLWSLFHRLQDCSSPWFFVCPLVGKAGLEPYEDFLLEGTSACLLVFGAGSCPSGGQDHLKGYV